MTTNSIVKIGDFGMTRDTYQSDYYRVRRSGTHSHGFLNFYSEKMFAFDYVLFLACILLVDGKD